MKKAKEPILERNYVQMWSRSKWGDVCIARQYEKSSPTQYLDQPQIDERPIYVALDGWEARDLSEVLHENTELKKRLITEKELSNDLLRESLELLEQKVCDLETSCTITSSSRKKWYQFWK